MEKNTITTPTSPRINAKGIKKLGGCSHAIKVFEMFNGGEKNPTINKICDEISAKGELSEHGRGALKWLNAKGLLCFKNICDLLTKQNESLANNEYQGFSASPEFWLSLTNDWNNPVFSAEVLKLFDNQPKDNSNHIEFAIFIGLIGRKREIKATLNKIPKPNKNAFLAGCVLALLMFPDISVDEADEKARAIQKMGNEAEISNKMHEILMYYTQILTEKADIISFLNKINRPALESFTSDEIISFFLNRFFEKITIDMVLVEKIKEIVGELETYHIRDILIRNLLSDLNQNKLEQLLVLKKSGDVNLCDIDWQRKIVNIHKEFNSATLEEFRKFVEAEVKLLDKVASEETIKKLLNLKDEVHNTLGEVFLKHEYKGDAASRRIELIDNGWLYRIVTKGTLSPNEKDVIKDINPLRWLELIKVHGWRDFYAKCTKIFTAYPPTKKLPLSREMKKYTRSLYEAVATDGGRDFVEALVAAGYKLPKMGSMEIQRLFVDYDYYQPAEKQINDAHRLIKLLPIKENCIFPVHLLHGEVYRYHMIFRLVFFNELRQRGVGIREIDLKSFAEKIRNIIENGYLYYWREFVNLPKEIYANELLLMIKHDNHKNKVHTKKLRKELKQAVETPEIFGDEQNLYKAYVYLVKNKVLTDSQAISKIGQDNFLATKHEEMGNVLNWYNVVQSNETLSPELCMKIINKINKIPVNKESLFCFEAIMEYLFANDRKLIWENSTEILSCYDRLFRKIPLWEEAVNMLRQLALSSQFYAKHPIMDKLLPYNAYQEVLKKWKITNSHSIKSAPELYQKLSSL